MNVKVPLNLSIAAGFELALSAGEILLDDAPKCDGRLRAELDLLHLRIAPKVDVGKWLGPPLSLGGVDRGKGPEREPALLRAKSVLNDPCPFTATSKTDPQTRVSPCRTPGVRSCRPAASALQRSLS